MDLTLGVKSGTVGRKLGGGWDLGSTFVGGGRGEGVWDLGSTFGGLGQHAAHMSLLTYVSLFY